MKKGLIQVFAFLVSTVGWLFISCTMAMGNWRVLYVGGQGGNWMIKASWYWSSLWKDCMTDTSSVTNCRNYDALWPITRYVQAVQGLMICSMILGFIAIVLSFFGMDCTYIGGSDRQKDRLLLSAAAGHFVGGLAALAGYSVYTNRVTILAFAPSTDRPMIRYGIGSTIFVGLVGCFFILLGALLYAVSTVRTGRKEQEGSSPSRSGASARVYSPCYRPPTTVSASAPLREKIIPARDTFV